MKNIFTIDLEDWYHGNFLYDEYGTWEAAGDGNDRVVGPTRRILSMLEETGNLATFFVLGEVARKFPDLIREIHAAGHEIASHSYEHRLVYDRPRAEFSADLERSVKVLEDIVGDCVLGFRAPYWSVGRGADWFWEVLAENGILYDSSRYPFRTYLYGSNEYPRFYHEISASSQRYVKEIPPTTLEMFGRRVPFCGGFYFRVLPFWFISWAFRRVNEREGQPVVFYLHPYEIDARKPRSSKGLRNNFILHANVKNAEAKLARLLRSFQFVSVRQYLELKAQTVS